MHRCIYDLPVTGALEERIIFVALYVMAQIDGKGKRKIQKKISSMYEAHSHFCQTSEIHDLSISIICAIERASTYTAFWDTRRWVQLLEEWGVPTINVPGIPLRCWNIFLDIFFLEHFGIFLARGIWYPTPPRPIPGICSALSFPYHWNMFEYFFFWLSDIFWHVVCRKLQYLHRNPSRSRQRDMTAWFCQLRDAKGLKCGLYNPTVTLAETLPCTVSSARSGWHWWWAGTGTTRKTASSDPWPERLQKAHDSSRYYFIKEIYPSPALEQFLPRWCDRLACHDVMCFRMSWWLAATLEPYRA